MGKNKEFTKYEIADDVRTFEAVSFDRSGYYDLFKAGDLVDLICHIDINEFRGSQTIQFLIKDIRGYREPLFKSQLPIAAFRKAEAERLVYEAMRHTNSVQVPSGNRPMMHTKKVVWTVDSLEGLIYYYNRIYDAGIKTQQLIMCPYADAAENKEFSSVETNLWSQCQPTIQSTPVHLDSGQNGSYRLLQAAAQ